MDDLEQASARLALAEQRRLAGDWAGCEAAAREAVALAPLAGGTYHYLGKVLGYLGRPDEAAPLLRQGFTLAPADAALRHDLSLVLSAAGGWLESYEHYEARRELPHFQRTHPSLPYPEWEGQDLKGKRLLMWLEQGLGDQIQMARFAPWLRDRGAQVSFLCHPPLARLFDQLGVEVIPAAGAVQFEDPDYWVMPMSIPRCLALTPNSVPNAPYLGAKPRPSGERVGLVWRGNPAHGNDANRSMPRRPDLPGISLAPEDTGAADLLDTAEIIAGLDLVVTVDTSVAHLAGAMGKAVWIMLPRLGADPRWLHGRTDSPWYPSARLYRQASPGDWDMVVAQVRKDLEAEGLA